MATHDDEPKAPQVSNRLADENPVQMTLEEIDQKLQTGVNQTLVLVDQPLPIPDSFKTVMDELCQLTISLVNALSKERGDDDQPFERGRELLRMYGKLIDHLAERKDLPETLSRYVPTYRAHLEDRFKAIQEIVERRLSWQETFKEFTRRELLTTGGRKNVSYKQAADPPIPV